MQAVMLSRLLEPKKCRGSCDVFGLSKLTSVSCNPSRVQVTGRKCCSGEEPRIWRDRSIPATYSAKTPVCNAGKQPNLIITRALAKDENSQTLGNNSPSLLSQGKIRGPVDKNVESTVRQWIGSTSSAFGLPALVLSVSEFLNSDTAEASQLERLGQIRQGVTIIERAVEGLSKFRFDPEAGVQVLDKALTVVTGSTIVDPEVLDQKVEAFIRGETDIPEELKKTVVDTLQGSWSNVVDVVTNFNPVTWSESAGASFQAAVEAGVERFAAFEISALVTLGERWLILTPLVVLPMACSASSPAVAFLVYYRQMRRNKESAGERARQEQNRADGLSAEAQARGERVKRELERIELRTLLLDAVNSLGEMALQPPRTRGESGLIRRRIHDILERLQELSPVDKVLQRVPEVASIMSASADSGEPIAHVSTAPTVDGDWRLIYASEAIDSGGGQELPQLPGIALDNIRQKVWQSSALTSAVISDLPSPLLARNTAEVRVGPFGVLEIAVQGSWETLENGQTALVSFDTFSARPLELFGNKITNNVPPLDITIPRSFQQRAQWGVVYVDSYIRISRGTRGQMFLFTRIG